ncbi:hypothetical protein ACFVZ5_18385 [Streptomyces sp. NPDC059570]|uniref:hypothetical protein n=1 Tax=Streptomyces sp. NPDC059570 TaxID=3346870 RepID=UPI003677C5E6
MTGAALAALALAASVAAPVLATEQVQASQVRSVELFGINLPVGNCASVRGSDLARL